MPLSKYSSDDFRRLIMVNDDKWLDGRPVYLVKHDGFMPDHFLEQVADLVVEGFICDMLIANRSLPEVPAKQISCLLTGLVQCLES